MHFEEHVLISWHIAQFSGLSRRGRIAVVLCGVLADVDALSLLGGQECYAAYHHTFGHSLLFGAVLVAGAALVARSRIKAALFGGLAFLGHLAADAVGTRWRLYLLWPFYPEWGVLSPYGWWLHDWRNRAVLAVLLVAALPSIYFLRRSPVELVSPELDTFLLGRFFDDMRPEDSCSCGIGAIGRCSACTAALCFSCASIGPGFAPLCPRCNHDRRGAADAS